MAEARSEQSHWAVVTVQPVSLDQHALGAPDRGQRRRQLIAGFCQRPPPGDPEGAQLLVDPRHDAPASVTNCRYRRTGLAQFLHVIPEPPPDVLEPRTDRPVALAQD